FWIKLDENTFLKGFSEELIGMRPNVTREFDLTVANDYPVTDLAGKTLHFSVTLKLIKNMQLPEVNDQFASEVRGGFTLEQLHNALREDMISEKRRRAETLKHNQIIDYLVSRVECELPQSYVKDETRRIMSEIVQQNQRRGVSEDALREKGKKIINVASRSAKDRLKASFILTRIGEAEKIDVSEPELKRRVESLAAQHGMSYEKAIS